MQQSLRENFNRNFTVEKYDAYLQKIEALHPGALDFRNAETPIFVSRAFANQMLSACEDIIDVIIRPDFNSLTEISIPEEFRVPNENAHPEFIVFDFGVCKNEAGETVPQLIEMQGFPTLFGYQYFQSQLTREYANVPENYDCYLNGYDAKKYIDTLRDIIVGDENPENVILLELFPEKQKTRLDFYCTEKLLDINTVCLTKLIPKGDHLFYEKDGRLIEIKRIYNRLIFDDLKNLEDHSNVIDITKPWKVQWVSHPNWFYRLSKFTLPLLQNEFVPPTYYLNQINTLPTDLENYVLKPLFSYAGMGVIIDVTREAIDNITDPHNWILQKKVQYADVIATPDINAKVEIRLFFFWKEGWQRPRAVHNLVRLSKGKMVGTRYNQDKTWVGGSVAFFEK